MELAPDFDESFDCLTVRGVEFLVVGAYGLRDFGFPAPDLTPSAVTRPRALLEMGVEPVQIHIMSAVSGVTWEEAWPRHLRGACGRHAVAFLGRDAFLQNKRAAGRPQDLADIDALREGEP